MIHSILAETAMHGVIRSQSSLSPKGSRHKKSIVADLLLTALIDAFSILLIFLLMSFSSTGEILYISKGVELPKASQTDILERNTVVKVEENKIYIEEQLVTVEGLVAQLVEVRKKLTEANQGQDPNAAVTVQADRRIKYEFLSQIVQAASHAGFSDIKFAVLVK